LLQACSEPSIRQIAAVWGDCGLCSRLSGSCHSSGQMLISYLLRKNHPIVDHRKRPQQIRGRRPAVHNIERPVQPHHLSGMRSLVVIAFAVARLCSNRQYKHIPMPSTSPPQAPQMKGVRVRHTLVFPLPHNPRSHRPKSNQIRQTRHEHHRHWHSCCPEIAFTH
jgi:hypothetical protein